jgi:pentatricopeptide repeat protein
MLQICVTFLRDMVATGTPISEATAQHALHACAAARRWDVAADVLAACRDAGVDPSRSVGVADAAISCACACGKADDAVALFIAAFGDFRSPEGGAASGAASATAAVTPTSTPTPTPTPTRALCNRVIQCCCDGGLLADGIDVYRWMVRVGVSPSPRTFRPLLEALLAAISEPQTQSSGDVVANLHAVALELYRELEASASEESLLADDSVVCTRVVVECCVAAGDWRGAVSMLSDLQVSVLCCAAMFFSLSVRPCRRRRHRLRGGGGYSGGSCVAGVVALYSTLSEQGNRGSRLLVSAQVRSKSACGSTAKLVLDMLMARCSSDVNTQGDTDADADADAATPTPQLVLQVFQRVVHLCFDASSRRRVVEADKPPRVLCDAVLGFLASRGFVPECTSLLGTMSRSGLSVSRTALSAVTRAALFGSGDRPRDVSLALGLAVGVALARKEHVDAPTYNLLLEQLVKVRHCCSITCMHPRAAVGVGVDELRCA